jgi:hypothetical protein
MRQRWKHFLGREEDFILPACKVKAENTAGAGDAYFAGLLSGIALGLKFSHAQQLPLCWQGLSVRVKIQFIKVLTGIHCENFYPRPE